MRRKPPVVAATAASLVALAAAATAAAQGAPPRFESISLVVGFSPGGGTDAYARLLARFLPRHLDGQPKVVVQNLPGSGSLKAVQMLAQSAPKGAAVLVAFNYGLITESQLDPERARVRLSEYRWIGSLAPVPAVCFAWHAVGVRSWADLMKRPQFIVGAPAIGSSNHINAMLMRNVLGAPIKVVTGYPGSADERMAIERGELEGGCGGWSSVPPDWIAQGRIAPLVSFATGPVDGLPASVPLARDIARSARDKQVIDLMIGPSVLGRPFIVAKDTPDDQVAALRAAFEHAAADPDLLAEARRAALPIEVVAGSRAEQLVAELYATPPEVVAAARAAVR